MGAEYETVLQSVESLKPLYSVGETIKVRIKGFATRRNGLTAWGAWHTRYEVYDESGNLLKKDDRMHYVYQLTQLDTAEDDFSMSIGQATLAMANAGGLRGRVVMTAGG